MWRYFRLALRIIALEVRRLSSVEAGDIFIHPRDGVQSCDVRSSTSVLSCQEITWRTTVKFKVINIKWKHFLLDKVEQFKWFDTRIRNQLACHSLFSLSIGQRHVTCCTNDPFCVRLVRANSGRFKNISLVKRFAYHVRVSWSSRFYSCEGEGWVSCPVSWLWRGVVLLRVSVNQMRDWYILRRNCNSYFLLQCIFLLLTE